MMRLWIGIDDTDSAKGMCTTYLAVLLIEELERNKAKLVGFPRLIRLNPTIPYKTRGNGAVSFLIESDMDIGEMVDVVNELILKYAMLDDENTNPGVVFVEDSSKVMDILPNFALKAVRDVVSLDEAFFIIGKFMLPHLKFKKGRGLIGALASVGLDLYDYTLELLAYRMPDRFGSRREYDKASFFEADKKTYPKTFDTVDWFNKEVVCVPNSPDPVLFGIRGEDISALREAFGIVKTEPIDRQMIFITNQATDMHLINQNEVKNLENYRSYVLEGEVIDKYEMVGGHVFIIIQTRFGKIRCVAFEPTKQFRNVIRKLEIGDLVEVYGSMKKDTINLEKINVVKLAKIYVEENPVCPVCKKRMESAGRNQGYRCKRCKTKSYAKILKIKPREIEEGFYEVPPRARRHLSKPLVRMNVRKKHVFR